MKVLIIEDEPFAQKELKRLLDATGWEIEVVEYLDSIEESVDWLKHHPRPDLIFLDIQLSDGLSFEIFNQVKVNTPVIFTTAYDAYAIKAFTVNSIDYLLKPIKQQALEEALAKWEDLRKEYGGDKPALDIRQLEELMSAYREYKSRFIARIGDQIKHIRVGDVAYFRAEDNEVLLVTKSTKQYFMDYSLEQLEKAVNPKDFFRLTRSYLVHIDSIGKISKYFNSRLLIELIPASEDKVLVSRVRVPEFLKWMDK